ncbi:MAG: ectoine utilization protein EutC [Gammaproteobacteria bacterium]|nr:ectoine utilization protein EutC [Gammaproteobacteria bacterium]
MAEIKILTEAELRSKISLDLESVDCIEQAFYALATKAVVMPPIMRLDIIDNNGEIDVKTAYIPGLDNLAIKISPGFFDNPKLGLPSVNGLMVLFSTRTGLVEALLLDNGFLTDIRTAAAGAVAAKHLSRGDSQHVAIIGAGVQAKMQLEALTLVRNIKSATIWARDFDRAEKTADQLKNKLGLDTLPCQTVFSATRDADIIVTTTPSSNPLLTINDIKPGQHITAMGADAEHKNEVDPEILIDSRVKYYCDRLSQTQKLGELHHAIEKGLIASSQQYPEIGQVAALQKPARQTEDDITFCDLTGTGIQDTAIATLAYQLCLQQKIGTNFET